MAVGAGEVTQAILDAVEESGASALRVSGARQNPRKVIVTEADGYETSLWVYAWNLTHGGRPTLPNEYRIQMTSVSSPLPLRKRVMPLMSTCSSWSNAPATAGAGYLRRGVGEHRLSYGDAQLWATARLNQIPMIFSEDFASGSVLKGVRFVDPFHAGFDLRGWVQ